MIQQTETRRKSGSNQHQESEAISALLELREFIANELDPAAGTEKLGRTVRPLTDGLGLESPKAGSFPQSKFSERATPEPREMPYEITQGRLAQSAPARTFAGQSHPIAQPPALPIQTFIPSQAKENRMAASALAEVIEPKNENANKEPRPQPISQQSRAPVTLRRASFFQRTMAAIMDEVFVWTMFLLAIFLTIKFVPGGSSDLTTASMRTLNNPILIRFASLEFATLWLCYFAVTFGILDMTFGMWVWNIRIRYGEDTNESLLGRKAFRVILSFLFYAPVLPLIVLAIHRRGRNILDFLSGTNVYRTVG